MRPFAERQAEGFQDPTELPTEDEQALRWQDANRSWWESHPMRYDWQEGLGKSERSREYFQEIDRRFFECTEEFLPSHTRPFDGLIDYDALAGKDVLEIGVGQGSVAQQLAETAGTFTGVDLTSHAVESTRARMEAFGLSARIEQADAEQLPFEDESFDFVWSWGVIHHSSDTRRIAEQIHRVLRPGGRAVLMVYYRGPWNYYAVNGLVRGVLQGELLRSGSVHAIAQAHTDGAIARYYSEGDWRALMGDLFAIEYVRVYGNRALMLPLPGGRIKDALVKAVPPSSARLLGTTLRMGSYLTSGLIKPR